MSFPTAPPPARKSALKFAVLGSDDIRVPNRGTRLLLLRNNALFQFF
jgi:hypothetical protein